MRSLRRQFYTDCLLNIAPEIIRLIAKRDFGVLPQCCVAVQVAVRNTRRLVVTVGTSRGLEDGSSSALASISVSVFAAVSRGVMA